MEVLNLQKEILKFMSAWDKKRKVRANENDTFIHLVEEVGEIARQYVNRSSRKNKFSNNLLNNAILDALMQLIKLASLRMMNIEKSIIKVIKDEQKLLKK